jgi:class 3 adenylate cyclase
MDKPASVAPRGFSFSFKLLAGIVGLMLVAGTAALSTIQRLIAANYRELLTEQFVDEMRSEAERRSAEETNLISAFYDSTKNPRLSAAYIVAHQHGDVRAFYANLGEEIEGTMLQVEREELPAAPLIRFVDMDGTYFSPPPEIVDDFGIWSPYDEDALRRAFVQLATDEEEAYDAMPRMGYELFALPDGTQQLNRLLVFPFYNNREYFCGDIVFCYPIRIGGEANQAEISGLWLQGNLIVDNRLSPSLQEELRKIVAGADGTSTQTLGNIGRGNEEFTVFRQSIAVDSRFPSVSMLSLFSLAQQRDLLENIRNTILTVAAVTLIISILFAIVFSRQITRSISRLVGATLRIAKGDFDIQLPVTSNDEVGRLTASFNRMASDLSLKERYRAVLDKVTDPRVAEALTGGKLELGGEELEVTVLFADIRNFTAMTEQMEPHAVVRFLNEHMTALTAIVSEHGGVVDKFVGDEIMVVFGAPQSTGNEAAKALQCARRMMRRRMELNEGSAPPVEIGIGLASGVVLAGCMGSEDRLNYTVLGPVVNLASRLCSLARAGEIRFDRHTYERLSDKPIEAESEKLLVRGFLQKIDTFTIRATVAPAHVLPHEP